MLTAKNKGVRNWTTVFMAFCVLFATVTWASADEELDGDKAVVSVYADLKAKAAIDDESMGFTPVKGLELTVGPHKFEFTYRDFAPQKYEVEVSAGVNDLYFQLEPRLEERKNKFNVVDLVILVGVAAAAVTGFVMWGKR